MSSLSTKTNPDKKARLEARISQEQKEMVVEAARLTGRSLTDFVVSSVVEAAQRTIQAQQILELSERDRRFFVETLLNPPPPSEKLRQSAKRYQERMQK